MTTKPTDLVRFAVDGSNVNASNISAPVSGVRDTGYPTNAILTSGNLNYFLNGYYRWLQYLSAGAFQGASSFDSTLTVNAPIVITGATGSAIFTATGGGNAITLKAPASVTSSYAMTLPQALPTAKVSVKIDSTGNMSFPAAVSNYSIAFAILGTGSTFLSATGLPPTMTIGTGGSACPLVVNVGDTISSWSIACNKISNATISVTATFAKIINNTYTQVGAVQTNSANNPGNITLGQSGLSVTVGSGESYVIYIQVSSGSSDTATGYSVTH